MLRAKRITCVGAGPAGLYLAALLKKRAPELDIEVVERNRAGETFGFGVVFSDATMHHLAAADPETHQAITSSFWHWDDIDTYWKGTRRRSTGHGFAGVSRKRLLEILAGRCRELGVSLRFGEEVTDLDALDAECDLLVGADGAASLVRARWAEAFAPTVDERPNRFVWLGTTYPFDAFTFYFKENAHGLFRVHAYRYEPGLSTFIVECTDETFAAAGLSVHDEERTVAYISELFREELGGHPLQRNRSIWRRFPTISNERWHDGKRVLIGDAVHTAHFSVGSGTKLAMEDAIALADCLHEGGTLKEQLDSYEQRRRADVAAVQRAAQQSLEWFEHVERYREMAPVEFEFSMLTRSLRVTHEGLKQRDPALVRELDAWFAKRAADATGRDVPADTPPMFTPLRLRELVLENRVVVSPMCQYSANDGRIDDWHLVHLGSRAVGGAGLIVTEMTDVSPEGRITPGCAGMYLPEHVTAWRRVTEFVHEHSYGKLAMQLAHAGRKGATKRMWDGMDMPLDTEAWPIASSSPIPYLPVSQVPRELTRADMVLVRDDFVRAAEMADEAGFDMLELHFAHGYLLACFLSPLTNRREDEYGGAVENRLRFPLEVFDAVRARWPAHKPISVRISATDWVHGGNDGDTAVVIARTLHAHGCDILDVSAGQTVREQRPKYGRLFQTPFSDRVRHEVGIPTMTVGAISSYADVNSILAAGRADLCMLARAHLFDPYWTRHAAYEQGHRLPWPKQYASLEKYTHRFK
ncbi:MAG: bifunctional salicylyl-CoA 5-hydroxylase/oxidoreductase [Myxococcales bacterium]|nr:bifunctional salicylyl-CoA 5-hydroxylase/oxidoreductase [Myxococcales bacterium]